ncbi:MAG: glutathione S-transferase family protein [Rhodospirillales bacterium]
MSGLRLLGWGQSTYTRSVLLALSEKGLEAELVTVDPFAEGGPGAGYLARQPFGKIPVLEQGDFSLYETVAILRYLDEGFDGPSLQPRDPRTRARLQQILSILDSYAYRALVWDLFVNLSEGPRDDAVLARGRDLGAKALAAIAGLMRGPWLCGESPSLADCHLAPILRYALEVPEGRALVAAEPALMTWWHRSLEREGWAAILQPPYNP